MLALRMYFWGAWTPSSATVSAAVTLTLPSAGGGGEMRVYPYNLDSFFEVREEYLRRVHSAAEQEVPIEVVSERIANLITDDNARQDFAAIVAAREKAYQSAKVAATAQELKGHAATITRLTLQLAELNAIMRLDDEVILLLLLTE